VTGNANSNGNNGPSRDKQQRRPKNPNDPDNDANIAVDYDDEQEGGSSEDAYESDFINDDEKVKKSDDKITPGKL